MKREVAELRKKNEELAEDLANAREEAIAQPMRGRRAGSGVGSKDLQKKVTELRGQVRELQKVCALWCHGGMSPYDH